MLTSSHSHQRNSVQSVLLFTDGIANAGLTDTRKILAEVKSFQTGVKLEHSHMSKVSLNLNKPSDKLVFLFPVLALLSTRMRKPCNLR